MRSCQPNGKQKENDAFARNKEQTLPGPDLLIFQIKNAKMRASADRVGGQMTTGANMVEAAVCKRGFCICYCFFVFFLPVKSLYTQQSDHKCRWSFNTADLEE